MSVLWNATICNVHSVAAVSVPMAIDFSPFQDGQPTEARYRQDDRHVLPKKDRGLALLGEEHVPHPVAIAPRGVVQYTGLQQNAALGPTVAAADF